MAETSNAVNEEVELLPLYMENAMNTEPNVRDFSVDEDPVVHDEEHKDDSTVLIQARRLLYISHGFAQFSEIAWQFSLALFLAAVTGFQSLILVSTYGLTVGLLVASSGGRLGRWIDESVNRLKTAQLLIFCENVAVLVATGCCFVLLSSANTETISTETAQAQLTEEEEELSWFRGRFESVPSDAVSIVSLVAIHILGAFAQVLDRAFLVAIERDWVVVLAETAAATYDNDKDGNRFHEWLSETNVAMKQIDLSCKVATPALVGIVLPLLVTSSGSIDYRLACVLVGAANAVALVVEYVCSARVYRMVPALAVKAATEDTDQALVDASECSEEGDEDVNPVKSGSASWLPSGLQIYFEQGSAPGGLGLAFLYANPLTFGNGIMTGYLLHRGMHLEAVGILRGVASVIGLLGTFAYHISVKRISLEATCLWSITYQSCCLGAAMISLAAFASDDTAVVGLSLLVGGVCLSRIGLWVYDIAVTQIQQQEVPSSVRGQVGGTQQSLNAFFNLLSFGLGVAFPNPKDFSVYASTGFVSVLLATLLFGLGVYLPRKC